MKKSRNKKRTAHRTYSKAPTKFGVLRWIIAGLIIFILMVFLTGNKSLIKLFFLHQQKDDLQQQKQELLEQNAQLKDEIKKLETDDKYIEKIARERYNMKKKDEEVYVVEPK
jgi:cell division protein DivIC